MKAGHLRGFKGTRAFAKRFGKYFPRKGVSSAISIGSMGSSNI